MANNYLQFSMTVPVKTAAEEAWCRQSLPALEQFFSNKENSVQEFATDIASVVIEGLRKEWSYQGFEWSITPTADTTDHVADLWLHADESGEPEQVAAFLRAYLKKFIPGGSLWFSWAYTCSKMRANEFGGGAAVVTADRVTIFDSQDWASRRAALAVKRLRTR